MNYGQRGRVIHISWRITALCSGLLASTALAALLDISFMAHSWLLLLAAMLVIIGLRKPTTAGLSLFLAAGLVVGGWRGSSEQLALQAYQPYYDKPVTLQGVVSEDVGHGDQGDTRMQLSDIRLNGQSLHGKVWASSQTKQSLKRNDTVVLRGTLSEGFGNISASLSPAELLSYKPTSNNDAALRFRDWFAAGIRQAIPEPQASLGSGFLTGQHSALPGDLSEQLKIVGLTHAVVASGSNLTILVGFMRRLFMRVSKYTATMAGALMTAGFVLVAGFSPSMTRAGLVTGLSLAAWYYGRRIHPLVLLPFAAAITVIINPSYLWGDIGWYLSFGAFAGVLVLAPLLQHYFWGADYRPGIIMETFIGTTSAQIATMPIILLSFGTYSSYALLANMLVVPLIPLAMLLTFIAGISGVAVSAIAGIIGLPATLVMQYMTTVIDRVANLPGAQGEVAYGLVALLASYGAMLAGLLYMRYRTNHNFGQDNAILIGERP